MTDLSIKREGFKRLSYAEDKDECLKSLIQEKVFDKQELWEDRFNLNFGVPSSICRYCKQHINPEDYAITYGYWHPFWFSSHISCKSEGYKQEAFECQTLDADCNDCVCFVREKSEAKNNCPGNCGKYNKLVFANSNFCSNLLCFEHRKIVREK